METFYIVTAFVLGFIAQQIGLPPLVGFLTAGFVLNGMGIEATETLHTLSDVGIILLLFSIGLKVKVKNLLQPQIWGTASLHMVITVVVLGSVMYGLSLAGFSYFSRLSLSTSMLFAFALSFSSTVFAVKILEGKAEMSSNHGRLAIGILIMQDLFAVLFITFSSGKVPSPLALGLFLLFFARKPLDLILNRSGHGELLVLLACILPIAGASTFEYVGLKPDLGALILGMLLAGHPKTDELSKAMFGFKDLFLVGFFLTIGMADLPNLEMLWVACLLLLFIPLKLTLFYRLLTRFHLRARTSLLTSLNLANYSEFGLIVGAISVSQGWLGNEWLVITAVAISISMVIASPLGNMGGVLYSKWHEALKRFESKHRIAGDEIIELGEATVAVFGMGRVGLGAFEQLQQRYSKQVVGLDFDADRVRRHLEAGRNVMQGDAADTDFWQRGVTDPDQVKLVLLTMAHEANLHAALQLKENLVSATVAAAARYDDEMLALKEAGVDHVFNIYGEAGAGFADHVCALVEQRL